MKRPILRTTLAVTIFLLLTACASHAPKGTTSGAHHGKEHSLKTMVSGIDQFDGGKTWGLNTGHGTFVVGPEVSSATKTEVYEHLMKAHNEVIVISYREIPASADIVAHKRVTAIIIQERPYVFSR